MEAYKLKTLIEIVTKLNKKGRLNRGRRSEKLEQKMVDAII
jgi:hypothetical protein